MMSYVRTKMNKRLISLTAVVLLLIVSLGAHVYAAEPVGYDYVIYDNNFENVETGSGLSEADINYRPESANYAVIEENGGKYYTFSPESTEKLANSGNLETGIFHQNIVAVKPVQKLKLEIDLKLSGMFEAYLATYYRGVNAGGINGSRDNFVVFTEAGEYYVQNAPELKRSYTPEKWMHFTIYADYANNVFSVYDDEGVLGENIKIKGDHSIQCFTQIRTVIKKGNDSSCEISIDNIVYSTTKEEYDNLGSGIDKDSYYSYEFFSDDFESYTRNEILPLKNMTGSERGFSYKTDNTQPEGARATVVEAPVEPEKYGNVVKLGYSRGIDNFFVTPYGLTGTKYDIGEVDKVKISASFMFDGYAPMNLRVLGSDANDRGGTNFWSMSSSGSAWFANGNEGVNGTPSNIENYKKYSTYELNKWYNYELYLDFESRTFDFYINGDEITSYHPFGERLKDFCVFRIGIPAKTNAAGEEGTELISNIYTDNWKYEFPQYLNINMENDGFTEPVATPDFNLLTVGETYTQDTNNIRIGNTNALVENEEGRGNVLKFNATTGKNAIVGVTSDWINNFVSQNGILPKILKLETNVKLSNKDSKKFAAYVEFMGRKPGTENEVEAAYMASFLSTSKLRIGRSEQGDTPVEIPYTLDTWYNFKFYVDAEKGVYKAYVNDAYIGEFLLNTRGAAPTQITQPLQMRVTSNSGAQSDTNFIYTDKIEISTLPCYCENVISQYKTKYNDINAAYCLEDGSEAVIVTAVYDKNGALKSIITEQAAAEGAKTAKSVDVIDSIVDTSEITYKVFALASLADIEPLAESIIIK